MSVNQVNQTTGALSPIAGGTLYADEPIGAILPFGGGTAPSGFLLCNGAAVSRTTYSALFAVIGTSFGAGDGSTTFNVPDLRESTVKGTGLTGNSNNHLDSDGLALGEFIDDRIQTHVHNLPSNAWIVNNATQGTAVLQTGSNGFAKPGSQWETTAPTSASRRGATTEVKSVGVNFIIKATTIALPSDFSDQVDDMIDAKIVNNLASGDMRAATSNTVYNCVTVAPTTEDITSCVNTDVATANSVNVTYFHNKQILINFNNVIPKVAGNGKTLLQNLPFNFSGPQAVSVLAVDISQSATDTHCVIFTNNYNNWLGAHLSGVGKHYYGQIISVIR